MIELRAAKPGGAHPLPCPLPPNGVSSDPPKSSGDSPKPVLMQKVISHRAVRTILAEFLGSPQLCSEPTRRAAATSRRWDAKLRPLRLARAENSAAGRRALGCPRPSALDQEGARAVQGGAALGSSAHGSPRPGRRGVLWGRSGCARPVVATPGALGSAESKLHQLGSAES